MKEYVPIYILNWK